MKPEQSVIDAIDALVDEQLAGGPVDDYSVNRYVKCATCKDDWHGVTHEDNGCPGAYARGYQKREWKRERKRKQSRYAHAREVMQSALDSQYYTMRSNSMEYAQEQEDDHRRGMLQQNHTNVGGTYQVVRCPNCQATQALGQPCACRRRRGTRSGEPGGGWIPEGSVWDQMTGHHRCVQCRRHLEPTAIWTHFDGTTPLCQECYQMRLRESQRDVGLAYDAALAITQRQLAAVMGLPEEVVMPAPDGGSHRLVTSLEELRGPVDSEDNHLN